MPRLWATIVSTEYRLCIAKKESNKHAHIWLRISTKRDIFVSCNGKSNAMIHRTLTTHTRQIQQQKRRNSKAVPYKHITRIDVFFMQLWNEYAQAVFSPAAIMEKRNGEILPHKMRNKWSHFIPIFSIENAIRTYFNRFRLEKMRKMC